MAAPGDEKVPGAAGGGRLRAAHADREQAIEVLKAAFVQGRLTKDEFDVRVGQVLASRTYADLTRVTADIPAGVATVQPPRTPARAQARKPVDKIQVAAWGASASVVLTALGIVAAIAANAHGFFYLFALAFIVTTGLAYAFVAEVWEQKRSRGQLPQGPAPGPGGQVSRGTGSAAQAEQLPQIDHGPQHTAEVGPSRLSRSRLPGSRPPRQRHPRGRGYAIGSAGRRRLALPAQRLECPRGQITSLSSGGSVCMKPSRGHRHGRGLHFQHRVLSASSRGNRAMRGKGPDPTGRPARCQGAAHLQVLNYASRH
jgi:hypothetical protein